MPGYAFWPTAGAALVLLAVACYWPSLSVPFQFDDLPNIVDYQRFDEGRLSALTLWRVLVSPRPLTMLTLAIDYRLWGLAVTGYHVVNLVVHASCGLLVLGLAHRLLALGTDLEPGRRRWVALAAAALFVAHPLHTQAVTYVIQRATSLGAAFALGATWLYLEGRARGRKGWLAAAAVACGAAVLCKENYVVVPGLLALAEALLFPGLAGRLRRRPALVAAALATAAGLGFVAMSRFGATLEAEQQRFGLSETERLLTQARVTWHYVSLLALPLPSRLRVDYAFPASRGLFDPLSTGAAVLATITLVAAAWRLRARWPIVSLAVLWFLVALCVEAALPLDLVFEHRVYLPSVGPLLAAALLLGRLASASRPAAVLASAAAVLALAGGTVARNRMWQDPLRLHEAGVAEGTAHPRSYIEAGGRLYRRGDHPGAERAYQRVLELAASHDPRRGFVVAARERAEALNGLGLIARDGGAAERAEALFRQAIATDAGVRSARTNLGHVLFQGGRDAEAARELEAAIARNPRDADALTVLGLLRARAGDRDGARALYARAIAADPSAWAAYWSRARAAFADGQLAEAAADLGRVTELRPSEPRAFLEHGTCLEALGRRDEAARQYEAAATLAPGDPEVQARLGRLRGMR